MPYKAIISTYKLFGYNTGMDETTKNIIARITQKTPTSQVIPSGHSVTVFYDCLSLTPNELARLAADAIGDLPSDFFDVAVGIAYNGISFANAVAGGRQVAILQADKKICGPSIKDKKIIIVDDVAHSGQRLVEAKKLVEAQGAIVIGYACIVDRSEGKIETLDKPLWSAYQTIME